MPADLSIVAIRDRSVPAPAIAATASTIHLDPRVMGQLAAETLKAWLTQDVPLTSDRTVEIGSYIERATTGPAPQ